jgi:hypothetical protein
MSSWGPGFSQRKGVNLLPYYHLSGMGDYAHEFLELVKSVKYAQNTNDFLFVFDVLNGVSHEFLLFQNTIKKNQFIRFLPYYPSSGFQLNGRQDLLEPVVHIRFPDRPDIYQLAQLMFDFQDRVFEGAYTQLAELDVPGGPYSVGVLLHSPEYDDKILDIVRETLASDPPKDPMIFVQSPSYERYQEFLAKCPSSWTVHSVWKKPHRFDTLEHKVKSLHLKLIEIKFLRECAILVGSMDQSITRLLYCLRRDMREGVTPFRSIDGKAFTFFP